MQIFNKKELINRFYSDGAKCITEAEFSVEKMGYSINTGSLKIKKFPFQRNKNCIRTYQSPI